MIDFEHLKVCIWIYDIDRFQIVWANRNALRLWESESLDELCAIDFRPITPEDAQVSLLEYQKSFQEGVRFTHNWHFAPKGIDKHAFCQLSGYRLDDGRMAMQIEAIPISKINYDNHIGLTAMLSSYAVDGSFLSANPPFVQAMGKNIKSLSDLIVEASVLKALHLSLKQSGRFENDVLMCSHRGERWYHLVAINPQNNVDKGTVLLHQFDINHRKLTEIALAQEVLADPLTGLLNRRGLDQKIKDLGRDNTPLTIYYIDLDGFKLINDSFGHNVGDQVLQEVTKRLLGFLPVGTNNFACRFGGDEFILGVSAADMSKDKDVLADELVLALSKTYFDENNQAMALSASIGIAVYPDDTSHYNDIIICADAAMYHAKEMGKRRWYRYQKGMKQDVRQQSLIAQHLYQAEKNNEFSVYYQPIIDFSNNTAGEIIGFEALLRWESIGLEAISTEEAINIAEKIRIIDDIEHWVARQALADLIILRQRTTPNVTMAINISATHLLDAKLPQFLLALLRENNLRPEDLTVELTESTLVDDMDADSSTVRQLVKHGIKISIDDFGTGYSSLAYLHHLPATIVKIDRSFVENIEKNNKTVKYIHKLIKAHNMQTLIEGVETEKQKEILLALGIHLHQGYLLGKPEPLEFYS